jgi:hypothetical protein
MKQMAVTILDLMPIGPLRQAIILPANTDYSQRSEVGIQPASSPLHPPPPPCNFRPPSFPLTTILTRFSFRLLFLSFSPLFQSYKNLVRPADLLPTNPTASDRYHPQSFLFVYSRSFLAFYISLTDLRTLTRPLS